MKKYLLLTAVIACFMIGCTGNYNAMMVSGVGLSDEVSCQVVGETEGSADIQVILGFIVLGKEGTGNFPVGLGMGKTLCEQAAAYKAIKNKIDADQIVCPRFETRKVFEVPGFYAKYSSTVKAKAVKISK